ncbi:hypothetical protein, partial [Salipaludibacillus sp. CF4.18]|uniref:hypothetical protein n=1 Tax=Salipaludibacillus sp. CF4.18 TaxID=3373081 RepID=UPI003EE78BD0
GRGKSRQKFSVIVKLKSSHHETSGQPLMSTPKIKSKDVSAFFTFTMFKYFLSNLVHYTI